MKWTAILVSALLLGGCASKSMPNLEDASPPAQASTAPGTVSDPGRKTPNLEDLPPTAQASAAPETIPDSGRAAGQPPAEASGHIPKAVPSGQTVEPPAEQQSAWAPPEEAAISGRAVKLTAQQRSDIEQGVRRGLQGPEPAEFGPMAATVSKVTSKSYIVCGWVKGGDSAAGYRPFLALYVPYMRTALLVALAGRQPEEVIRGRCVGEGVPLPS
jgi:hypothetical protein